MIRVPLSVAIVFVVSATDRFLRADEQVALPSNSGVRRTALRSTHAGQLQAKWNIESWSLEELRSLHDDLHDRYEGFQGRYAGTSSSRSTNSDALPPKALRR